MLFNVLTYDKNDIEAIVERSSNDKTTNNERPIFVAECCGYRCKESDTIAGYQSWDSAVMIGDVAKNQTPDYTAEEKRRLGSRTAKGFVANPIQL